MSKKDFIALADAFIATRPSEQDVQMLTGEYQQWKRDRSHIADVCIAANPRFDYHRWISYIDGECGPNGGKVAA